MDTARRSHGARSASAPVQDCGPASEASGASSEGGATLKVAVVHTYSAAGGAEGHESAIIRRDRALATLLGRARPEWRIRGFACTEGRQTHVVDLEDGFLPWTWSPLDDLQGGRPRGKRTSAMLTGEVKAYDPDALLVKGIGTPLADGLMRAVTGAAIVAIVGGRYRYPAYRGVHLALTEDAKQESYLRRRLGADTVMRLPKLVEMELFGSPRAEGTLHDAVCVSGFLPHKNQAALLNLREHPVRLAFVGDGPTRESLEVAFEGGLAQVTFYGTLDKAGVADVMHSSKLLVHPSLSEGFPRVVAEGMAIGLPVIAVRGVVGPPVMHGVNGLLIRPRDICQATLHLLAQADKLSRFGAQAQAAAHRNFSASRLLQAADQLATLLERSVIRDPGRREIGRRASWRSFDAAGALAIGAGRRVHGRIAR